MSLHLVVVVLIMVLYQPVLAAPPPTFVCDGTPYPTFGSNPSTLQQIDKQTLAVSDIAFVSPSGTLNATGYNILDDYIYGLKGRDFVRLAADGSYIMLGKPTGVGAAAGVAWNIGIAYAGTMDTSGIWYGHDKNYVYHVNIGINPAPGSLTYERFPRSGSYMGTMADLSFNPLDGNLYGMSAGKLRKITSNGVGSTVTTSGATLSGSAGGAWSTSSGTLYFYNNSKGLLFSVDMTKLIPEVAFVGNVASNGTFDATACTPPTISKKVSKKYVVGGEQFSYDFKLTNPFTNPLVVQLTDNLQPYLTFISGSVAPVNPGGGTITTFDDDTLVISNITIPAGLPPNNEVKFSAQVLADIDIPGTVIVPNQASISYGSITTYSDDPDSGSIDDPTVVTIYAADWGDAPFTYGGAKHILSTTSHFMGTIPDAEVVSQNAVNGGVDGSGDDATDSADEDGVKLGGTTLQGQLLRNNVPVTLTINTSGAGRLHGWIDWDRDGVFGNQPGELIVSESSNTSGPRSISLLPPDDLNSGISYARFRYSTDPAAAAPDGTASDGEVEDYQIILSAGFTVSGRVYDDSNADGVNDPAESGIRAVTLVLYDTLNNSCISTQTDASGAYVFTNVLAGSYQVYEADRETVPLPQNCTLTAVRDPVGYLSTTASLSPVFSVGDTNPLMDNVDFGDVRVPLFELDNTRSVLPNASVVHPHTFTALSDGSVNFSIISAQAEPVGEGWSSLLLRDNNCNGELDAGDTTLPSGLNVNAGEQVCILTKVLAPSTLSGAAFYQLVVQSEFIFGNGSIGLPNNIQTHTDLTRSSATNANNAQGGEGKLVLRKSVWNVSRNMNGAVVVPGETLRYTIRYENVGNGPLNELVVTDSVPAFTQLVAGSMLCTDTPPGLPLCTANSSADGSLRWAWQSVDQLLPAAAGSVSYEVVVE